MSSATTSPSNDSAIPKNDAKAASPAQVKPVQSDTAKKDDGSSSAK